MGERWYWGVRQDGHPPSPYLLVRYTGRRLFEALLCRVGAGGPRDAVALQPEGLA